MRKLIIWSVGTNGDGSSQLVSKLINAFDRNQENIKIFIFISKYSLLERKIVDYKFKKIEIIKLPSFFRNNLIQLIIKFFAIGFIFRKNILVLDDFPFLDFGLSNQTLLLHQPNLCYLKNKSLFWKSKRIAFALMLNNRTKVIIQTKHMAKRLMIKYKHNNTYVLTHSIN
tara:strand:- start:1005 stop:1514 length:510 start_codon:yes stop_codon:yes gene_type:complete